MRLSVIIPVRNRSVFLEATLLSLLRQREVDFPYEILVMDDHSTDDISEKIKNLSAQLPPRVSLRHIMLKRKSGVFHAGKIRNRGIQAARGEILLFLDCDNVADPYLLKEHDAAHQKLKHTVVLGYRFLLSREQTQLIRFLAQKDAIEEMKKHPLVWEERDVFRMEGKLNKTPFPWLFLFSHNFSVHRELILKIGGFDEYFKGWGEEDVELGYRFYQSGALFYFDKDAICFHQGHAFDIQKMRLSQRKNRRYFIKKHPAAEVELVCANQAFNLSLLKELKKRKLHLFLEQNKNRQIVLPEKYSSLKPEHLFVVVNQSLNNASSVVVRRPGKKQGKVLQSFEGVECRVERQKNKVILTPRRKTQKNLPPVIFIPRHREGCSNFPVEQLALELSRELPVVYTESLRGPRLATVRGALARLKENYYHYMIDENALIFWGDPGLYWLHQSAALAVCFTPSLPEEQKKRLSRYFDLFLPGLEQPGPLNIRKPRPPLISKFARWNSYNQEQIAFNQKRYKEIMGEYFSTRREKRKLACPVVGNTDEMLRSIKKTYADHRQGKINNFARRAQAYLHNYNNEKAKAALVKALKIDSEDVFTRFLIAQVEFEHGRYRQAQSEFRILALQERPVYLPKEEIYFWMAKTYLALDQKDRARKFFNLLLDHPQFGRLAKSYLI